jgi:hypothetical protein
MSTWLWWLALVPVALVAGWMLFVIGLVLWQEWCRWRQRRYWQKQAIYGGPRVNIRKVK